MALTKDKLIEKINDVGFLRLDPKKDAAEWRKIYLEKTTWMLHYYQQKDKRKEDGEDTFSQKIGLAISLGIKNAMESFQEEKGVPFFFYAKRIVENEIKKQWREQTGNGLKVSDSMRRRIKRIKAAIEEINQSLDCGWWDVAKLTNVQAMEIAKRLQEPLCKVLDAVEAYKQLQTFEEIRMEKEGKDEICETRAIDRVVDVTATFEDEMQQNERIRQYLECVERVYLQQREKTKPILSMLIVVDILNKIDGLGEGKLWCWIKKLKCVNEKLLLACRMRNKPLTHKKIAQYFDTSEVNIAQIWKRFLEKAQREIRSVQNGE